MQLCMGECRGFKSPLAPGTFFGRVILFWKRLRWGGEREREDNSGSLDLMIHYIFGRKLSIPFKIANNDKKFFCHIWEIFEFGSVCKILLYPVASARRSISHLLYILLLPHSSISHLLPVYLIKIVNLRRATRVTINNQFPPVTSRFCRRSIWWFPSCYQYSSLYIIKSC